MLRENPGFFQASLSDPFQATAETVQYMCGLVQNSLADPIINRACEDALKRFALLCNTTSPSGKASACWFWAKQAIKFVHHQKLFEQWGIGDGKELQLLIAPDVLLKMEQPKGDCAVFTCLICAMLDCLSVPREIVTVAVDPRQPNVFSHVYPRAVLQPGFTLPLDASHGKYPGWEVPANRVTLKQVWNSQGEPIQDQDSGFRGLHGLGAAPVAHPLIRHFLATHPVARRRVQQQVFSDGGSMLGGGPLEGGPLDGGIDDDFGGMSGLGQDDGTDDGSTGGDYGPTDTQLGLTTTAGAGAGSTPATLCPDGSYVAPGYPCPSVTTNSNQNNALATALANFGAAWTKIAGQVIAPQVTETGPGGTSITGPAAALQSILGAGVNLGGTNYSLLLIVGVAVAGLFLVSSMGKK